MLQAILFIVVVLLLALLGYAATRPSSFRVSRSIDIKAAAQDIFKHINDFHQWRDWSPWERLDPNMQREYSGTEHGEGAIYQWQGNKKVGQGRMEIIESSPFEKLVIKLDFLKPFEAHNTAEFVLEPEQGQTKVTWVLYGPQPFMAKLMSLFVSMDKIVGKDFEKGLLNMKEICER